MEKDLEKEKTLSEQSVPDNAPHETEPDADENIPAESEEITSAETEETAENAEMELEEQPEKPSLLKRMIDALPDFVDRTGI